MAGFNLKKSSAKKNARRAARRRKQQQRHRGPVMRFKFSRLVLLWILSLILCFGAYLYKVNFHPEELERKSKTTDSSSSESASYAPAIPPVPEGSAAPVDESSVLSETEQPSGENENSGDESSVPVPSGTAKINPVPESAAQTADYLRVCIYR